VLPLRREHVACVTGDRTVTEKRKKKNKEAAEEKIRWGNKKHTEISNEKNEISTPTQP
jgi:hypothetical protein